MAGSSNNRSVRYVVFHKPGPQWQYGVDFREQDGVGEHVQHYLKLHEQGKLELGGPFLLQDAGGMMVATKDVSQEELDAFAASDPAVEVVCLSMRSARADSYGTRIKKRFT